MKKERADGEEAAREAYHDVTHPPREVDVAVDAWFVETFHNRGIECSEFNRMSRARDELKRRLRQIKE